MAIMSLSGNMVRWKIELKNDAIKWTDIESMAPGFGKFLNTIKIVDGIMVKQGGKKESAPSTLELSIISNNYMENLFTEGCKIRVYIGYDLILLPLVFDGEIRYLPDGGAREMLTYTVKAYSNEIVFSNIQRNRSFAGKTKTMIITEIIAKNDFIPFVDISKDSFAKGGFSKIQKGLTDMELLDRFAKDWNCTWWVDSNNVLFFVDYNKAHEYGDQYGSGLGLPYTFGYRTDRVSCNVESIDWIASPAPGGSAVEAMMEGFGEFGKDPAAVEYKIVALGQTWELRGEYLKVARENPIAFGKYALYSAGQTTSGNGYDVLRKFFVQVPGSAADAKRNVPHGGGEDTGVQLTIRLNEGDPELKPPRSGRLYSGVLNPAVNTANLPAWLFKYGALNRSVAKLNINETILTYDNGLLSSEIKCTLRAG